MKQTRAWEIAVKSLRLHFLQANSHIPGIDEHINQIIIDTLEKLRQTSPKKKTESMVNAVDMNP